MAENMVPKPIYCLLGMLDRSSHREGLTTADMKRNTSYARNLSDYHVHVRPKAVVLDWRPSHSCARRLAHRTQNITDHA